MYFLAAAQVGRNASTLWESSSLGLVVWKLLLFLPLCRYNWGKSERSDSSGVFSERRALRNNAAVSGARRGKRHPCLPSPASPTSCFYAADMFVKYCLAEAVAFSLCPQSAAPAFLSGLSESDADTWSGFFHTNKHLWLLSSCPRRPGPENKAAFSRTEGLLKQYSAETSRRRVRTNEWVYQRRRRLRLAVVVTWYSYNERNYTWNKKKNVPDEEKMTPKGTTNYIAKSRWHHTLDIM